MKFVFNYGDWHRWVGRLKEERLPSVSKYLEASYFPPPLRGVVYDSGRGLIRSIQQGLSKYGKKIEWVPWQVKGFHRLGKKNLVEHLTPKLYLKYAV